MKSTFSLLFVLFVSTSITTAAEKPVPNFKGQSLAVWVERFQKAATDMEQQAAAVAIMGFGDDAMPAVPRLAEMLDDRSEQFRELIYSVLSEIGPRAKAAAPKLVELLKQKLSELQKQDTPKEDGVIPIRDKRLKEELRGVWLEAIAKEVGYIIRTLTAISPDPKEVVPVLIESLKHPTLAKDASEALGAIGAAAKDAVPGLIKSLENPEAAKNAIEALYAIGPSAKNAIPAIRRTVQDAKTRVRKGKYDGMGEYVYKSLSEYNWVGGLYHFGSDAISVLLEFLKEGDPPEQASAADALGKIKPVVKQATPLLRKLLQAKDADVRGTAAGAIWRIERDLSSVPILISLVEKDNESAIKLLGEISPEVTAALEKKKDDHLNRKMKEALEEAIKRMNLRGTPKPIREQRS